MTIPSFSLNVDLSKCRTDTVPITSMELSVAFITLDNIEVPEGHYGLLIPRNGLNIQIESSPYNLLTSEDKSVKVRIKNLERNTIFLKDNEEVAKVLLFPLSPTLTLNSEKTNSRLKKAKQNG